MDKIITLLSQLNKQNGSPIITLVSIALLSLTAYFTSTVATRAIQDSINTLDSRVSAIEIDREETPKFREQVRQNEKEIAVFKDNIGDMKTDIKDIRKFLLGK